MAHDTRTGPATNPTAARRFVGAVDEQLGLDALRYPVPEHANNLAWSLGGLTAVCLMILIATSIVLAQFYQPDPGGGERQRADHRRGRGPGPVRPVVALLDGPGRCTCWPPFT
ncbi:MAG TPA: hypothetical protein VHO29_19735 [Marmoricola sp.]|nr:hypothetical protein [Marmoricola sp.]